MAAILLVVPASAHADEAVGELGRLAPVAGYAGWEAWSVYDELAATEGVRTWAGRGTVGSVQPRPAGA